ncbi:cysteine--tRNA ligase [Mucilaginibacter conchicola]|uniref:Cysteine--tRNA ligase n=1 Tax=Mucilaginibacter conchicola TaxID=2303333 RepID=A0A372NRY8_9SPHI|nr:cysteine--tRNA ligase [Mucilaginibacter conchicola]RFZ91902.1 cysteine--tRNA ligase [Mucilaginibacter conchicola]
MTEQKLFVYNSLTRTKEEFIPLNAGHVGMYVCGPTVYSDVHLGNCRTFIAFDLIYRYLLHLGYKVRYVRNITDAGHLESDGDEGEDKVSKKAKIEQLEPMEIVQRYTVDFHKVMEVFNALPPSIEPTATGHIIEQIELVKTILEAGYAYEVNGSVYFDVEKYSENHDYGELNGRKLEDLLNNTRTLGGQDDKRGKLDFALWIKAKPEHLMQWPSPWGMGFPGWHLECSAMSNKYLGHQFDIHGGGMDLMATHHTNEIAQNIACCGKTPAHYWIHTNMLTVNGQKMSKSLGNSFLPYQLFTGDHALLKKGYSPMVMRFFFMQASYRSTVDFSNEAIDAAEIFYKKLAESAKKLATLQQKPVGGINAETEKEINGFCDDCYSSMNDNFNSPKTLEALNNLSKWINSYAANTRNSGEISAEVFDRLRKTYNAFFFDVLGLKLEDSEGGDTDELMQLIIKLRNEAKANKDYATSDKIREGLKQIGFQLNDSKQGTTDWARI